MSNHIWIDPPTCDTIGQGVVGILKLLTKDLFVKNTQTNRLEKALTIQLKGTTKVEMLYDRKINVMTKHLRPKNTRVKLRIVSNEGLRTRSNECHKVCENLEKWTTLRLGHIICDTMDGHRSGTDSEVCRKYHSIKCIHETTPRREARRREGDCPTRIILPQGLPSHRFATLGETRGLKVECDILHTGHTFRTT